MKQILLLFKQKKNPPKKITNCHDNIHFNFHCFGAGYRPSVSVYGRMYKVNRKRSRAPCVSALMYSTSGRSRYPTPELPGARLTEYRHSGDRKLESELDGHIVCASRCAAALI